MARVARIKLTDEQKLRYAEIRRIMPGSNGNDVGVSEPWKLCDQQLLYGILNSDQSEKFRITFEHILGDGIPIIPDMIAIRLVV